ncbi:MAG: translesion error-prone DNA polymerase V autoproteolytic subunit [Acidobacteria bacterium]|nr:translesion error-prone DNA polymerase V autoproteolytic subunit [Acidobacteriota bacterium]
MALRITELYRPELSTPLVLRLFLCRVPAGFPSPADDYIDEFLDLNKKLITNKSATFLARAEGNSMQGAGIFSGDLLIVDRSLKPVSGKVVVASLNGELVVKRYGLRDGKPFLLSENPSYAPIPLNEDHELVIWGVVVHCIHTI